MTTKRVAVLGGGGFIGGHLARRLREQGAWVRVVDLKYHEFFTDVGDEFIQGDLRDPNVTRLAITPDLDEVYQLAADMGGAEFVFTGENDADIIHNSALINLNVLNQIVENKKVNGNKTPKVFYSSSACIYPERNQMDPNNPDCREASAYPAAPDSEYGWEKLFSERAYAAFARCHTIDIRVARFHNIFGPQGTWTGGREKAPAALCRKIAQAADGGQIEIFGSGEQTRSFLYVDECVDGVLTLMTSTYTEPVNIGSDEMITINNLARLIADISGKHITIRNVPGPVGVNGRNSNNDLVKEKLNWAPKLTLREGLVKTYPWIVQQVASQQIAQ